MCKKGRIKHGHTADGFTTPTYGIWRSMKYRCNNPNDRFYSRYGGRGIAYDPRWEAFENFLADMGERPEHVDALSLERIDNNGNYCKDNCRWATSFEQAANHSKRTDNTSGVTGVSWSKSGKKWMARGMLHGKRMCCYFLDFEEACKTRKNWELQNAKNR